MKEKIEEIKEAMVERLADILLGERIPLDFFHEKTAEILYPANRKMTKTILRKVVNNYRVLLIDPSPIRNKILEVLHPYGLILAAYETDFPTPYGETREKFLKSMLKQWEMEEANNHYIYGGDAKCLLRKLIKSCTEEKVTNPYAADDGATPGRLGKAWQRGHDGAPPSKSWVRGRATWNAYQEGKSKP